MSLGRASLHRRLNLTEGPILPALLTLAWPVVLSELLQTAYNLADTYWVGRLGAGAVASISVSFPIVLLFISIAGGLTVAGTGPWWPRTSAPAERTMPTSWPRRSSSSWASPPSFSPSWGFTWRR